jgi:hypothetical protein
MVDEDEFEAPSEGAEEDASDSDIFGEGTLPDVDELGDEDEPAPEPDTEGDAETVGPVSDTGPQPSGEAGAGEGDEEEGSGSYRSFEDIRDEVEEKPIDASGTAPEPETPAEPEAPEAEGEDISDEFSSTFDDLDDETAEMDFSGAFEDPSDTASADAPPPDDPTPSDRSPTGDVSEPDVDASDDEEDDLERAMRSLFPVLPDEEELDEPVDEAPDAGAAAGTPDEPPTGTERTGEEETDEPDPHSTGSQFEAIKEDVQKRQAEKDEEEKKRSRSTEDEEEASTEEIEKIWSILEDME